MSPLPQVHFTPWTWTALSMPTTSRQTPLAIPLAAACPRFFSCSRGWEVEGDSIYMSQGSVRYKWIMGQGRSVKSAVICFRMQEHTQVKETMLSHAMAFHSARQNRASEQSQYTTVCGDGHGRGLTAGTAVQEFMEKGSFRRGNWYMWLQLLYQHHAA